MADRHDVIEALTAVLESRRAADPESSYVAALYRDGVNRIARKVGEEATEVVIAAKDATAGRRDDDLIGEVADLWFHCLVLLVHLGQDPAWVLDKLSERFGISGLDEKAGRQ